MIKVIDKSNVILMDDMKPLQIGTIVNGPSCYNGDIVMRTASTDKFEVMDLTVPGEDGCWTSFTDLEVKLLPIGQKVTIELSN